MSLLNNRRRKLYSDSSTSILSTDDTSSSYYKGSLLKGRSNYGKQSKCSKHDHDDDDCESSSTVYKDKYVQIECEKPKRHKKDRCKHDDIVEEKEICMTESNLRSRRTKVVEALSVDTYSLDTDIIRWKPRLINVPSEEYKTLDDAVCALKPRSGGYVIKLHPRPDNRTHELTKEVCGSIDHLSIIGDENPFAGVSYIQRCNRTISTGNNNQVISLPPVNNPIYIPCNNCSTYSNTECKNCTAYEDELVGPNPCHKHKIRDDKCRSCGPPTIAVYGRGPFDIDINDNVISVTSIRAGMDNQPDFSCVPPGTRIMFITDVIDGGPRVAVVERARGNSITIAETKQSLYINRTNATTGRSTLVAGAGFVFLPNVAVTIRGRNFNLSAQERLFIKGVSLDAISPLFFVHSPGGVVELANCHIVSNICYRGRYLLKAPNIYTGLALLWAASTGEAYCQTFYGLRAHLQAISAMGLWDNCYFVFSSHAVEALHGSVLDLSNSYFISCCMALSATMGSDVGLTGASFCHNTYALILTYQARAGAVVAQIPGLQVSQVTAGPWFVGNTVMIVASYNSYAILPLTGGTANIIPFVIDGKVYTTLESNPVGNINQLHSMVIISRNPFAPDTSVLGCDRLLGLSSSLNRVDAWSVTTMSTINDIVNIQGLVLNGITADQALGGIEVVDDTDGNNGEFWGRGLGGIGGTIA